MAHPTALASLIFAAQLAGVDVPRSMIEEPTPVFSIGLDEVRARQDAAFIFYRVGRENVGFSAALGPEAEPWIKLTQKGAFHAAALDTFALGIEVDLPYERYRFVWEQGAIRAFPAAAPQSPLANVPVAELIGRLYRASAHVQVPLVEYAVTYERGDLLPAGVSLIRRNEQGIFMVTSFTVEDLNQVQWFVSVDGIRYGLKITKDQLTIYSLPAPLKDARIERPYMR